MIDFAFECGWLRSGKAGKRKQRLQGFLRPDRIIVGEVCAGEALHMLQAVNTAHNGSLTTVHAGGTGSAEERG